MRTGRVPLAYLLLVLASTVLQVSCNNDMYWEGEEYASGDSLEVTQEEPTVLDGHKRLKRQWNDPFGFFTARNDTDTGSIGNDDADIISDVPPNKTESEPGEKKFRVTLLILEPYIEPYTPEFLNLSRSLAVAVDSVFQGLPGTQRSSLEIVRIQRDDDYMCHVTCDIVTTSNEDTDIIKDVLRNHIKNNGRLGDTYVRDSDFSEQIDEPGITLGCDHTEFSCDNGITCLPMFVKCNGRYDCRDGTDEMDCREPENTVSETTDTDATTARSYNDVCPPNYNLCDETRCVEQSRHCDGISDCSDGADEVGCQYQEPGSSNTDLQEEIRQMHQEFQQLRTELAQLKDSIETNKCNRSTSKRPSVGDTVASVQWELNEHDQGLIPKDIEVNGIPEGKVITIKLSVSVADAERARPTVEKSGRSISLSVSADPVAHRSRSISASLNRREYKQGSGY